MGGGGAVRASEIYKRLAARHQITIVSGKYPGAKDYLKGVQYHFEGTEKDNYVLSTFSYAARANRFLRRHARKADIVIEDFAPWNPVCSYKERPDAVIQVHQREGLLHLKKYFLAGAVFFMVEKYYPRRFRNQIVISEFEKKRFGLERARIIPNGFDPSFLDLVPAEKGYLLFLGRFHIQQKGLDILARAFKQFSGYKLVIAGAGKDDKKVRRLFKDISGVEFPGYVRGERKVQLLRDCEIFLLPSRYEGQPLTVFEAAACGKPVLASDIPELRFAVEAGFALSFKKEDPEDLAKKMRLLSEDAALRADMGRRGRQYAKQFTWDAIAKQFESFLLEVAAR